MTMRLRELGQLHVSSRAAGEYAAATGLPPEQARRRLTELLLDARLLPDGHTWRRRSRTDGVDLSAHVIEDGQLHVVTQVTVRRMAPRPGRPATDG
jgi:hypothetical protein